jgi:hypothetical protein
MFYNALCDLCAGSSPTWFSRGGEEGSKVLDGVSKGFAWLARSSKGQLFDGMLFIFNLLQRLWPLLNISQKVEGSDPRLLQYSPRQHQDRPRCSQNCKLLPQGGLDIAQDGSDIAHD